MNAKIERVVKEIDKTKEKIGEQQARLRELEKQKTELENLEIVEAVRGMSISFDDLAALLKNNPATLGQVVPKSKPEKKPAAKAAEINAAGNGSGEPETKKEAESE
jgi:hypothetical protein